MLSFASWCISGKNSGQRSSFTHPLNAWHPIMPGSIGLHSVCMCCCAVCVSIVVVWRFKIPAILMLSFASLSIVFCIACLTLSSAKINVEFLFFSANPQNYQWHCFDFCVFCSLLATVTDRESTCVNRRYCSWKPRWFSRRSNFSGRKKTRKIPANEKLPYNDKMVTVLACPHLLPPLSSRCPPRTFFVLFLLLLFLCFLQPHQLKCLLTQFLLCRGAAIYTPIPGEAQRGGVKRRRRRRAERGCDGMRLGPRWAITCQIYNPADYLPSIQPLKGSRFNFIWNLLN